MRKQLYGSKRLYNLITKIKYIYITFYKIIEKLDI